MRINCKMLGHKSSESTVVCARLQLEVQHSMLSESAHSLERQCAQYRSKNFRCIFKVHIEMMSAGCIDSSIIGGGVVPKHQEKGPDGFSLDNYKSAENYNSLEWAQQIMYRLYLKDEIDKALSAEDAALRARLSDTLALEMENLIKNPIGRADQRYSYRVAVKKDSFGRTNTVFDLTVYHVFRIHDELVSMGYARLQSDEDRRFLPVEENFYLMDQSEKAIDRLISHTNYEGEFHPFAHLSIDLLASDDHIKDNFSQWLAEYREKENKKRVIYTRGKLKQWHENRVLPYADLKLWTQWSGNELSDDDLIEVS